MSSFSTRKCLASTSSFQSTDCIIINEASSSKTAWFFYNSTFNIIKIKDKNKLSRSDPSNPGLFSADSYAAKYNSLGYYNLMVDETEVLKSITNSKCQKIYWALLATGGMRNLNENQGDDDYVSTAVSEFYSGIKTNFQKHPQLCYGYNCKDVVLLRAQTIPGKQEGEYAWKTLEHAINSDCHAVIDLGGATGQFANKTFAFSGNIGKGSAVKAMKTASVGDDIPDDSYGYYGESASASYYAYDIDSCYNEVSESTGYTNPYNGTSCRNNIAKYLKILTKNNADKMPIIYSNQYCKIFTISNFYNYFNDICDAYLPYVTSNNLSINTYTLNLTESICVVKKASQPLIIGVRDYQNITDEFCVYWNAEWMGNKANYAKDACFSGNYNYQILRQFGLTNDTLLHVHYLPLDSSAEKIYVDSADWALGAAISSIETCNINAAASSRFTVGLYEGALTAIAGIALAYLLNEGYY